MQTAVSSFPCSGNVLDLNAYRRRRAEPLFPEEPLEDEAADLFWDEEEADLSAYEADDDEAALSGLPFAGAAACREVPSPAALLDMAASAAMLVCALAAAAAVLF